MHHFHDICDDIGFVKWPWGQHPTRNIYTSLWAVWGPIPILSPFFLCHPSILSFSIRRILYLLYSCRASLISEVRESCWRLAQIHLHIGFFTRVSHHNFWTQYFQENRLFIIHRYVALRLLISLFGRHVVCSGGISHGNRHTHTQTKYCNPRCACTPRVNHLTNAYVATLTWSWALSSELVENTIPLKSCVTSSLKLQIN